MNKLGHRAIYSSGDVGCRHLAVRVIELAFRDLSSSGGSRADRDSARAFLAGSRMLYRWCEIANLSAAGTIARARQLERGSRIGRAAATRERAVSRSS